MQKDLEQMIFYGTLAPSGHNTQPWKFYLREDGIVVYPDFSRALPVADADHHELFISLGCAIENIVVAATHFGYDARVLAPAGNPPHIRIILGRSANRSEHKLFPQVAARQTSRNYYDGNPIPEEHLRAAAEAAMEPGVRCLILSKREAIAPVIAVVKEACARQYSNPAFRAELLQWTRFNKGTATRTYDGLYSVTMGAPNVPGWMGRLFLRLMVSPHGEAKRVERRLLSSSAVAVFAGKEDSVASWISTGRSFERFALTTTGQGIHHAHENMACEDKAAREKLARVLGLEDGEQPLLLVRLGYSEKMSYSYRRPIEEVIVAGEKVTLAPQPASGVGMLAGGKG